MEKIPLWFLRVIAAIGLIAVIFLVWQHFHVDDDIAFQEPDSQETAIGAPASDFAVPANQVANKKKFQLSSVKGFPIILHFWATWCGPCVQELPQLIKLAQQMRQQGFVVVAVAMDEDWRTVDRFFIKHPNLAEMRNQMVLILDPPGTIANQYGVSRFPETLLINSGFVVDNKLIGAQPWTHPKMQLYLERLKKKAGNG